jgi:hypothetical protein
MVAQFVAALERPVSRVRLENYRPPGDDDLAMVTNYFYNLELSESLYPTLQAFEISLRNSIDAALAQHHHTAYWFDVPGFLPNWQRNEIAAARQQLSDEGKPHDPGRIIAELKLGFWHSLFNRPFEQHLWRPNASAKVLEVFPQISKKQRNRQAVWYRIQRLRNLRNRVMHYEPVWNRRQIAQDHFLILETIRWISEEMFETIAMCDRFPTVLQSGYIDVQRRIQAEIQRRYPTTIATPPQANPVSAG